nr:hypothetical protein [Methanobrevibacter arboriphilus]
MLKTILAIFGGIVLLIMVGSMTAGFFIGVASEPESSYSNNEIIDSDITIKDTLNRTLTDTEGYNLINSTEYGLGVEVPDYTDLGDIFTPGLTLVINGEKYTIVDYIYEDKRDFIALEPA